MTIVNYTGVFELDQEINITIRQFAGWCEKIIDPVVALHVRNLRHIEAGEETEIK